MNGIDIIQENFFTTGMTAEEYRKTARNYRSFVGSMFDQASVDEDLLTRLKALKSKAGQLYATVNTEDWCGDWACNASLFHVLFSSADIPLRIFRGSEHPDFKDVYERDGDDHIPALSVWDADGNELLRWIEAPELVAKKKSLWKADHPEFEQTFETRESDPEAAKRWPTMYRDFLEMMGDWYKNGMWNESAREIVEGIEHSL